MVELNYDATGQEGMSDRSVLPAGEYAAAIAKAERKEAKTAGKKFGFEFHVMHNGNVVGGWEVFRGWRAI